MMATINMPSSLPDDEYRAYISWPRVPNAEKYKLRYSVWTLRTGTTATLLVPSYNWQNEPGEIDNPASGSVTFTLDGLQRNQLYAISVQAKAGNRKESFWSEPVMYSPEVREKVVDAISSIKHRIT